MENPLHIPYDHHRVTPEEMLRRSREYREGLSRRRSIREFSTEPVPKAVISELIMTASSAPSGAHKQPWTFCAVSSLPIKRQIRDGAEKEEKLNYQTRMSESWLADLAPLGTNWEKPFLEDAPWLIVVFKKPFEFSGNSQKKNYYVNESVGLAVGFLLTAVHLAGLVTLTHTPSPMNFLESILSRPKNERAFLLLPVGYPANHATVPDLKRKAGEEVIVWYD